MNADAPAPGEFRAIVDWIIERALGDFDLLALFDGLCQRLTEIGVPVARANAGFTTLHPMFGGRVIHWDPRAGASAVDLPYAFADSDAWRANPIRHLVEAKADETRHCLERPGDWQANPVLTELQAAGITDYVGLCTRFGPSGATEELVDGLIGSWATARPGGFSEADLERLKYAHRCFALAAKIAKREQTTANILGAYLGGDAAKRVLDGQIRLGDGNIIPSVIWYSDMRGSTALAETLQREAFLAALNTYFECSAGAVLAGGGDVLRFIGDAVLGIFPIGAGRFDETEACQRALDAAADAEARLAAANRAREAEGLVPLAFGLGLHMGDVLFGNIGIPERIEFSVIGPAANEVARIEGMTKALGHAVLLSADVARHLEVPLQDLGEHAFAGVAEPRRLFAPG